VCGPVAYANGAIDKVPFIVYIVYYKGAGMTKDEKVPKQYRAGVEALSWDITQLVNKLWPSVSELGKEMTIYCDRCTVEIRARSKDDERREEEIKSAQG